MEIKGRNVLVLGGYGLVGMAVCRQLMYEEPNILIVSSLLEDEARKAVERLRMEFPDSQVKLVPIWGNVFVRATLKDKTRAEVLASPEYRRWVFEDVLAELSQVTLATSYLAQIVMGETAQAPGVVPDAIVDCINTATALAYQDIYTSAAEVLDIYDRAIEVWRMGKGSSEQAVETYVGAVERLLASLYVPQLVRHVQILHEAMKRAGTRAYIKIGTSGTGGMGLNIPYTHGEEKPSRVLLSKSAMAGAHSLLLFLMARTPGSPAVKEIKPTAAITWKQIGYGPIKKRGREIPLYDCPPEQGMRLTPRPRRGDNGQPFDLDAHRGGHRLDGVLESVYIDTGENGYFSLAEFTAITTLGQMEGVTPEDIAFNVVRELKGISTGHDVVAALDGAVMGPSYRAGVLRHRAMEFARQLEREHGVDSVAFEILGPPKLSKLLYEAYMLKRTFITIEAVAESSPEALSAALVKLITEDAGLRSQTVSIGIPILMAGGVTLLCAARERRDHRWEWQHWNVTPAAINRWADTEWIDLRVDNMARWKMRMANILSETKSMPAPDFDSSSHWGRSMASPATWQLQPEINVGEVVGWIFVNEEEGGRMKG